MKKTILLIVLLVFYSCGSYVDTHKVHLVELPTVYNYKGCVNGYKIDKSKPFVINYYALSNLGWIMKDLPPGSVDKLIKKYNDFTFVFYVDRLKQEDTLKVMEVLNKYDCKFPVILDFQNEYYKKMKQI